MASPSQQAPREDLPADVLCGSAHGGGRSLGGAIDGLGRGGGDDSHGVCRGGGQEGGWVCGWAGMGEGAPGRAPALCATVLHASCGQHATSGEPLPVEGPLKAQSACRRLRATNGPPRLSQSGLAACVPSYYHVQAFAESRMCSEGSCAPPTPLSQSLTLDSLVHGGSRGAGLAAAQGLGGDLAARARAHCGCDLQGSISRGGGAKHA